MSHLHVKWPVRCNYRKLITSQPDEYCKLSVTVQSTWGNDIIELPLINGSQKYSFPNTMTTLTCPYHLGLQTKLEWCIHSRFENNWKTRLNVSSLSFLNKKTLGLSRCSVKRRDLEGLQKWTMTTVRLSCQHCSTTAWLFPFSLDKNFSLKTMTYVFGRHYIPRHKEERWRGSQRKWFIIVCDLPHVLWFILDHYCDHMRFGWISIYDWGAALQFLCFLCVNGDAR